MVLILVLVEVALRVIVTQHQKNVNNCLNPCFSGSGTARYGHYPCILFALGLNPCFSGILVRVEGKQTKFDLLRRCLKSAELSGTARANFANSCAARP